MAYLKCGSHGRQKETFVCKHIVQSLEDGEARGFYWGVEDGVHEALCENCNALSPEAFAAAAGELIAPLCYGCYREAAALNGAVLD